LEAALAEMDKVQMNLPPDLITVLRLAAQLPSGLDDARAAEKLVAERDELLAALAEGDVAGALTEIADGGYYVAKHLDWAARRLGEVLGRPASIEEVLRLTIAKYTLRAAPGNPKDDEAERAACLTAVEE
jgi:hypothetical protein